MQTMAMFRWLYLVLAINIRAGVHVAVAPRFPHQNHVVVRCASRISLFVQCLTRFAFVAKL